MGTLCLVFYLLSVIYTLTPEQQTRRKMSFREMEAHYHIQCIYRALDNVPEPNP